MRTVRQYDFSGGTQRRTSRFLAGTKEVYYALNCDFDEIGSVRKRLGYIILGSAIATGSSVLELFSYAKTDGNIYFLSSSGSDLYEYNTGTEAWDAQSQSLTADKEGDMATFVDYAYYVNGNDSPLSYDGSSWSNSTNVTSSPTAYFVEPYRERLYMLRTDAYPSRVFYSSRPSGGAITWDTSNDWFDVYPDNGEWIRGATTASDRLFIFKDHSVHTYDLGNLVTISHYEGTRANKSIGVVGPYAIWLDERGVMISDGGRPQHVSQPVHDFTDGLGTTTLASAVGCGLGDCYYLFLGTVNGVSNVMVKLNIVQRTWTIYSLNDSVTAMCRHENSSGSVDLYAGMSDGKVMKMWSGNTDNGTAISSEIVTRWVYPTMPERFNNFREIILHTDYADSTTIKAQTDLDTSWSSSLGTLNDEFTRVKLSSRGRGIRFKIEDSATDERSQLFGYSLLYKSDEVR